MPIDARVQELIAAGDLRTAATEALRVLGPQVLRYLRSVLRNEADAGDAFSQFAENLWSGLAGFRGQSALRTWAFRIARNAAANLRDEAWRRRGRPFATGEASALALEIRTASAVRAEQQHDALSKLREALTDDDRALLALRVDQQLSWEEVAEILSADDAPVTAGTLTKRFERLKDRLARMAKEQGLLG
ncbi:MAG TPA: sigma-70 family RNA polymerase sigma factor [Anaeromyxobacteraceae bacterium]|nr:sigma-70 family RNA polymerase sigma factor [Anaeromyxobacteraceae bacterium]